MSAPRRTWTFWPHALLAALLVLSSGLVGMSPGRAQGAPASTITGTVFQDYNANGVKDTSPANDAGVAGVTVTAYAVVTGVTQQVGQTTSGANGTYTLTTSDAGSGPYRIEFTWNNTSGPLAGYNPGPVGVSAGSTVQFVNGGGVANLGLVNPADYSQDNPMLIVNRYVPAKNITPGPNQNEFVLLGIPYGGSGNPGAPAPTNIAQAKQIGATFGLAYQRASKTIFASAYMKRHVGFGPGSTGAIYAIQAGPDGVYGTADDAISTFLDLNSLFPGSTGTDPHPTTNEAMSQSPYNWFYDQNSFAAVGKIALGDMDISDDGLTLFVVNLNDRKLYKIPIGDPPVAPAAGAITPVTIPTGLPNAGPGALPAGSGSKSAPGVRSQRRAAVRRRVLPWQALRGYGMLGPKQPCAERSANIRVRLRPGERRVRQRAGHRVPAQLPTRNHRHRLGDHR